MDREQAMQEAREEALNQAVEAFSRFGNGGIGLAANFAFEKGVEYAAASNDQLEAQKSQIIAELEGLRLMDACASLALYRIAEEPRMTWEEVRRIAKAANEERKAIQMEYITKEMTAPEVCECGHELSQHVPDNERMCAGHICGCRGYSRAGG